MEDYELVTFHSIVITYKLGTLSATRKELGQQVRLQHPVLNDVSCDGKNKQLADSVVPVVTSVTDKTVKGFSTPPVNTKKSRER